MWIERAFVCAWKLNWIFHFCTSINKELLSTATNFIELIPWNHFSTKSKPNGNWLLIQTKPKEQIGGHTKVEPEKRNIYSFVNALTSIHISSKANNIITISLTFQQARNTNGKPLKTTDHLNEIINPVCFLSSSLRVYALFVCSHRQTLPYFMS